MYFCFAVKVRLHIPKTRTTLVHYMFDDRWEEEKYTEIMEVEFPISCKTPNKEPAIRDYILHKYLHAPMTIEEVYSKLITASEFAELSAV